MSLPSHQMGMEAHLTQKNCCFLCPPRPPHPRLPLLQLHLLLPPHLHPQVPNHPRRLASAFGLSWMIYIFQFIVFGSTIFGRWARSKNPTNSLANHTIFFFCTF